MSTHLGQLVKEIAKSKGVKFTWLAEQLHMSRQNLNSVFQRHALDVELLQNLSDLLDYNFFDHVTPERFRNLETATETTSDVQEPAASEQYAQKPKITIQITVEDPEIERKLLELVLSEDQLASLGMKSNS